MHNLVLFRDAGDNTLPLWACFWAVNSEKQLEKIAQHSTMMKMLSRVVILPRPSFKPLTESCGKLALGDIIIKNFCVRNSKFEIPHDYYIFSGSLTVQTKCLSGQVSSQQSFRNPKMYQIQPWNSLNSLFSVVKLFCIRIYK